MLRSFEFTLHPERVCKGNRCLGVQGECPNLIERNTLYMSDLQTHSQRTAAARAGFSERTARRFDADPTLPSNRKIAHGRTVADPLAGYWESDLLPLLEKDSALQAVTLLRHLQTLHPQAFPDDRVRRTLDVEPQQVVHRLTKATDGRF